MDEGYEGYEGHEGTKGQPEEQPEGQPNRKNMDREKMWSETQKKR